MRRMAVATVHLAGLGPNVPALVDPSDPQIARWIRGGMLRYVDDDPQVEVETIETVADAVSPPVPEPQVDVEAQQPKPKPRRSSPMIGEKS